MAKRNRGRKRQRMIFVQYVCWRDCYNNPSVERFKALPRETREYLIATYQRRTERKTR